MEHAARVACIELVSARLKSLHAPESLGTLALYQSPQFLSAWEGSQARQAIVPERSGNLHRQWCTTRKPSCFSGAITRHTSRNENGIAHGELSAALTCRICSGANNKFRYP
jgi:hypothetical protein